MHLCPGPLTKEFSCEVCIRGGKKEESCACVCVLTFEYACKIRARSLGYLKCPLCGRDCTLALLLFARVSQHYIEYGLLCLSQTQLLVFCLDKVLRVVRQ